ncbi:MAG TPA: GNAT family N-acetyltransferase [Bryobacteraceae bacterium]|jgi:ribosomal protein S18 acetylase RimI-like enzyme|nr:GNAT family N-acetyltransferase [Bryobacteraceae bacterium]
MSGESMLDHLPWHALRTEHARFACQAGSACRYPGEVAPFAATADYGVRAMQELALLLAPGEIVYLMGDAPAKVRGVIYGDVFPCLQMVLPEFVDSGPAHDSGIELLTQADAADMVELTRVAFPGFFRLRTCEMGVYYGIRAGGELIAMAGERMALPGYREVSGVCTHPAHRGKGYAVELIEHLLRVHARADLRSFLHVSQANTTAIPIYRRLGFAIRREVLLYPVSIDQG